MIQTLPEALTVERKKASRTMRQSVLLLLLFLTLFVTPHLYAGGPLNTLDGRAVVYQSSTFPIPYHPDRGNLGSFSNGLATSLVDTSFQTWGNVPTATITFQNGGQLPVDITRINYIRYLDNYNDGINPVIFDSNGAIIDAEFGIGASNGIIGFAGSGFNSTGYYVEGLAVLNGKFSSIFDEQEFQATFFHEIGHFLGLDHTQINGRYVQDGNTVNDSYVPTMYPTATDDDTPLGEPNPDDEAALTLLYPASNVSTVYGMIRGSVKREDGQPVLGANVVAVKVGDEDFSQFSSVSDYYLQNNGEYGMHVTPGEYHLFIEPINRNFTAGSSVGPYAENSSGPSFINPVVKEYYNGEGESGQETDLDDAVVITVAAGQTVSQIDFIAEGNVPATTTTTAITSGVNLVPYTPSGCDAPLVPSSLMGTTVVSTLCGGRATYIDLAVLNEGSEDITETFFIDLYVDGVNVAYVESGGLQSGYFVFVDDWLADPVIRAGLHTVKIIVDSENAVQEFNENDNEYTQTFTWNICLLWTPALYESIVGRDAMENVARLRRLRDDVLRVDQTGSFYVDLLYDYSEEVATLLLRDPALRVRTAGVLARVQPDVNALLAGKHITVTGVLLDQMEALLDAFEAQASPGLKTVLEQVKKEMREGTLFEELGITVK